MKVMKTNGLWTIHGDDLEVCDELPAGTYRAVMTQSGPALSATMPLNTGGAKLYGDVESKTDIIVDGFLDGSGRLGVILQGDIGLGKTMMARLMSERLLDAGVPVIIVGDVFDGLFEWLPSIDQRCMILFDEFDKMSWGSAYDDDISSDILSYFDGTSRAPHLDVITTNSVSGDMARYLQNRPGRFRWNVRFDSPLVDDIVEYLRDRDVPVSEVDAIMRIYRVVRINYDMLDAIVSEVDRGHRVVDFIDDMNIVNDESGVGTVLVSWVVRLSDGSVESGSDYAPGGGDMRPTTVTITSIGNCNVGALHIEAGAPDDGSPIDPSTVSVSTDTYGKDKGRSIDSVLSCSMVRREFRMTLSDVISGDGTGTVSMEG